MVDELTGLVGKTQRSAVRSPPRSPKSRPLPNSSRPPRPKGATTTEIGATSREISATSRELVHHADRSGAAEQTASLAGTPVRLARMEDTMRNVVTRPARSTPSPS